jgi:hypothetical protein
MAAVSFFTVTGRIFKAPEMPNIKCSVDQAVAYKLHKRALAEGRSIAAVVKSIIDREMATAPVATPVVEAHDAGGKKVVGAYLSDTLASAIEDIAKQSGRSKSHVLRALVRDSLVARGYLPETSAPKFLDTLATAAPAALPTT